MEKSGLSAFKLIVIFQYLSYQLQSRTSLKENGKKCCVAVFRKKKPDTRKKTVTCTVCKLNQPFSGNTTNMFPHLRLKHPDLYPKKNKDNKNAKQAYWSTERRRSRKRGSHERYLSRRQRNSDSTVIYGNIWRL
jgi:hypothetical protein